MIKLKQVLTVLGKGVLVFEADFPDGTVKDVQIDVSELEDRLKQLRELLGRGLTVADLKDVVKNVVNQIRSGAQPFPQKFDYTALIGVDLEQ
jgi:hypothetical protein